MKKKINIIKEKKNSNVLYSDNLLWASVIGARFPGMLSAQLKRKCHVYCTRDKQQKYSMNKNSTFGRIT